MQEYTESMRATTDEELRKLESSYAYKRALAEKGRNPGNWNWQTREAQEMKEKERMSTSHHVVSHAPAI